MRRQVRYDAERDVRRGADLEHHPLGDNPGEHLGVADARDAVGDAVDGELVEDGRDPFGSAGLPGVGDEQQPEVVGGAAEERELPLVHRPLDARQPERDDGQAGAQRVGRELGGPPAHVGSHVPRRVEDQADAGPGGGGQPLVEGGPHRGRLPAARLHHRGGERRLRPAHALRRLAGGERRGDGAQVVGRPDLRGRREERLEEVREVAERVGVVVAVEDEDRVGVRAVADGQRAGRRGRDGALEVDVQLDLRERREVGEGRHGGRLVPVRSRSREPRQ